MWATRPFECDEWAVDIEQRGWAGHGPGWTKALTVQKGTILSHSLLCLIMQDLKKNFFKKPHFINHAFLYFIHRNHYKERLSHNTDRNDSQL